MSDQLQPLRDYSRQHLRVGNPPFYVFGENDRPQDKELMRLSLELRIAEALERQTELLEALYHRRDDVRNNGVLTKHGREVGLTFTASSVAMAETLSEQLRQVFVLLEQADKEGGLDG